MKSKSNKKGYGKSESFKERERLKFLICNSLTRVLKLEKDLLQMKSALDRGSNEQPTEKAPDSLSSTLPVSQEEYNQAVGELLFYNLKRCVLND